MTRARTYGRLELHDGRTWVLTGAPPHVSLRLKSMFARIAKYEFGPVHFPNDVTHCMDLNWFLQRYPMEMTEEDRQMLTQGVLDFGAMEAERERILMPDYAPPARAGFRPGRSMRHYQAQAVDLLASRTSLLLGDEVGLGKTISGIGAALLPGALPAVFVVEGHLQQQWADQIAYFTNLSVHQIKKARPYSLPKADCYVFRYSNIAGWTPVIDHMVHIGLACWDEIQSLRKGPHTAKGHASMLLSKKARLRLGLTATPIYNYGIEIHELMSFIDAKVLGGREGFIREWCGGSGSMRALGSYLREQHVFLRRTRRDVGNELPPVNRIVETIGYDEATVRSAEDLARELAIKATTGSFVERGQATRDLDIHMRKVTGLAKAKTVAAYVRILLESSDEPVVLVGWHRDVYDIWLKELDDFEPAMYTGSESNAGKRRSVEHFLNGDTRLLILSLRSGAGLDGLQEVCSTVVFGELDWSPGIHHQVIGRLHRDRKDGVKPQVMAVFLVTDDGSDPPMTEVLGLKASQAAEVVDPHTEIQAPHSDESHVRKLVERYLEQKDAAA